MGLAFGGILLLLAVTAMAAGFGINGIVGNATEVIDGNKLRGELTQREVDHLNWANKVNALLTDKSITELEVQTDHTKCAMGQFLYGEGREQAVDLLPELEGKFKSLEEPHQLLHESAIKINDQFVQADLQLGSFLRDKKNDHLGWMNKCRDVMLDESQTSINVQTDPHKCGLGVWLYGAEFESLKSTYPDLAAIVNDVFEPHSELHGSVVEINDLLAEGNRDEALAMFNSETVSYASETIGVIDRLIEVHDQQVAAMEGANAVFAQETVQHLNEVKGGIEEIIEYTGEHILTDQAMLSSARGTNATVVITSVVALVFGVLIAFFLTMNFLTPIRKGVAFAQEIASGDLTAELEMNRKDEIGVLCSTLETMKGNLRGIVGQILDTAQLVSASSEQLASSADETARAVQEVARAVQEVASGSQETARSVEGASQNANQSATAIESVARDAEDASKLSQEANDQAVTGQQAAHQAVDKINGVTDTVNNAAAVVEALGQKSQQIGEIVDMITNIAGQTNLLALNAAIEAARAGEMGRGFAVVAEEVRKLAEESNNAGQNISTLIGEIRDEMEKALEAMNAGKIEVTAGREIVQNTGQQLEAIVGAAQQVMSKVENISASSQQVLAGTSELNTLMTNIAGISQESAAGAEEASASTEQQMASMQQINSSSAQLSEMANTLTELVSRFKI
jgi:methyl-accepting chemotaxis protein